MFIELNRSYSFRKVSQYCLHDVDAQTSDRVDFVETRNLATRNPQAAWRIMASRTYVQSELKEKAGVSLAGRKDGKAVGHMLVSWGRDEADAQKLDRAGMVQSIEGALKAIGADDRQAMIIAHNDTSDRNPHCHVIINLIGDDGRLLKSYNDHKKLSRFALEEEIRIHGRPIVQERNKRWHDRDAGETPAPMKKKPRHQYELEKQAENDNTAAPKAQRLLEQQKTLEREKARQCDRHRRNQERLRSIMEERERRIKLQTEALVRRSKTNARKAYDQTWRDLHDDQQAERQQFEENEKSIRGSIENGLRMVDWFKLFHRPRDTGADSLKTLFQTLTQEAKRREILDQRQQSERDKLRAEQKKLEREAEKIAKQHYAAKLEQVRDDYVLKAEKMRQRQERSTVELKKSQQNIAQQRNELLKQQREQEQEAKRKLVLQQKLQREFDDAAKREQEQTEQEAGDTDQTDQSSTDVTVQPKKSRRERKPRDPNTSRRRRDIENREQGVSNDNRQEPDAQQQSVSTPELDQEAQRQYEEQLLDYLNQIDRGHDLDFEH
ncbi:relaxase/mobilization nuclease domain-containing protein [Rhodopirellula sp. MGV]|uniref:relaxase/mobilization nuclease domain-containing protein n=1 Tax=Rhodopirellula sp. MGV TaxID=2023130 RepID=UPI000BD9704B|nr:hypothetical protein [Rhodopirellula sp. MGV]OYP28470.1 hypothetical protein CGZ80_27100 [Rhodopirellula sp. MGV]